MKHASLYFHIPFCSKKCPYCHFYVLPNQRRYYTLLEEGLTLEWEQKSPLFADCQIQSIYFGGGTPTLYPLPLLAQALQRIANRTTDCEITIETNPEEASLQLYEQLLQLGFNRLSIGVQSLDDRALNTLERVHNAQTAEKAIHLAAQAGFQNISIDLMYDLPNQTLASWEYTLSKLPSLPFQHLSLYNLTIEPHTRFYKRKNTLTLPTDELSLAFLKRSVECLTQLGLERYEISAFAQKGFRAVHNTGYWTGRPFLGFGPSAFSYWDQERFQNISHLHRYHRQLKQRLSPVSFSEKLAENDRIKELLCVGLRLLEGVHWPSDPPEELSQTLHSLIDRGLLEKSDAKLRLSSKGLLFHDLIASEII